MPLWLSVPAVVLLGVSSWISTLDPLGESSFLWAATATAASFLVLRLLRMA